VNRASIPLVDTVLLKVASRCNIDCGYCYVYHSPDGQWRNQPVYMSEAVMEDAVCRLGELRREQNQDLAVVLHGGEPLLAGYPRLEKLLTRLRAELGMASTLALQTNGILINDEYMDLFAATRTRVSVSLDGPKTVNDSSRLDHRGRSTFPQVLSAIKRLKAHPRSGEFFHGVLAVVDPYSEPAEIYDFFKSLHIPSIDFLYRDGNHARLPYGKCRPDSVEYGEWMAALWQLYINDPNPIPIECLDNLVRTICGKSASKEGCGDSNFGILIVDTDGTITKNDTLKNSYENADRFAEQWHVSRNSFKEITLTEEYLQYVAGQTPAHEKCRSCALLKACGGGMVLHRWSSENGYVNPSIYCHDQMYLMHHILETLQSLAA
jgi:uncharacterized protein